MTLLLQLFTAAPLKNYRTQVLGFVVLLTAIANWLVGDMSFIEFMQNLPAMVGGLSITALGAKVNTLKDNPAPAAASGKAAKAKAA